MGRPVASGRLVVVGAGGHGREVLDIVEALVATGAPIDLLGVLDDAPADPTLLEERGIARFKLPERLEVLDALPLTSVGKISKAALRERVAAALAAERTAADE